MSVDVCDKAVGVVPKMGQPLLAKFAAEAFNYCFPGYTRKIAHSVNHYSHGCIFRKHEKLVYRVVDLLAVRIINGHCAVGGERHRLTVHDCDLGGHPGLLLRSLVPVASWEYVTRTIRSSAEAAS